MTSSGESNLAFVQEEDEELLEVQNNNNNNSNSGVQPRPEIKENNTTTQGSIECNKTPNPSNTNRVLPPNTRLNGLKENHGSNDRRRSSGEIIRQNRTTYKRISRAFSQISFHNSGNSEITYELKGMTEDELLHKLFHLFDYDQSQKINQDEWIELLKSRLNKGEKETDFVEVLESVAYAVCGDEDIDFESFRTIFYTKNVLTKFFRVIDRDCDGVVSTEQIMEFITQLNTARSSNRLTKENISWLENLFRQYVGEGNEIRKEDFTKIIQTKNQFFTDRVFDIFDKDASGSISLQEFLEAMHQFAGQEPEDKIRFLFKVYDVDGDGAIQCHELGKVIRACMEENGMKFSDEQIHELTMALFEDADVNKTGVLTYDALKGQLGKHEGLLENLSISIERWLVPPKPKEVKTSFATKVRSMKPHQLSLRYIKNNYVYLMWLFILIMVNLGLFISKTIIFRNRHQNSTVFLALARGGGQCLNFNCTFIVIVMLRRCLTFLRARGAGKFLPIDQHIYFHKMTGWFIFGFSIFHTIMHLINIETGLVPSIGHLGNCRVNASWPCPLNSKNWTYWDFLFLPEPTSQFGILSLGLIPGYAFNSGVILMIILTIMVICSLPFVRRGGCFEVFYWTHLLYFVFWTLLIIHAPNFWKWFIVPGIVFLSEQVLRFYQWRMGRGRTCVSSGILLPSKVTHLVIRRPPHFEFHPGDYVFVRIPRIAKYEWHPFTISSAPEQEDAIWLHIRAVGQWTTRLYEYFEAEQNKLSKDSSEGNNKKRSIKYKECSQEFPLDTVKNEKVQEDKYTTGLSSTSLETVDETNPLENKNIPLRMRSKPELTSTKSLPNVHERMMKRDVKLTLRNSPQPFQRSLSTNSAEPDDITNMDSPRLASCRVNRVPISFKYMRNKPTVITLKTPSFENQGTLMSADIEKSVEEGRAINTNNLSSPVSKSSDEGRGPDDTFISGEGDEFHPIIGTTRASNESLTIGRPLEIYLDGPYGAPSSHIFRAEHAVLIGAGIGVTPFASILQSIMHRYWASRVCCPNCEFTWCGELPKSVLNLRKVDFYWINRDQRSFEWFVHLLSQLEIEQAELGGAMERFLDMHMYITSALQRTDMKAVGLQLALDLLHEKEKRDLITGLKTRTNAGRPNWSKIFKQLSNQQKGKITIFYCGPPALARTLKLKCDEFGFSFRKELF